MTRRSLRRLAFALLAVLGFAQASVALAACVMDRAALPQMLDLPAAAHECCDPSGTPPDARLPLGANACVAQSTADLQAFGVPAVPVPSSSATAVLAVPAWPASRVMESPAGEPMRAGIPRRILLHSFLV